MDIKTLYKELQSAGFKKRGKLVHKRINDVICIFAIETPSDNVYMQFALIPVFLPANDSIVYTYGNRLGNVYNDIPTLTASDMEAVRKKWNESTVRHIKTDVIPFVHRVSTANCLSEYIEYVINGSTPRGKNLLFCGDDDFLRLELYCKLKLRKYDEALEIAQKYNDALGKTSHYTQSILQKKRVEISQITELVRTGQTDMLDALIHMNEEKNTRKF